MNIIIPTGTFLRSKRNGQTVVFRRRQLIFLPLESDFQTPYDGLDASALDFFPRAVIPRLVLITRQYDIRTREQVESCNEVVEEISG